MTKIDRRQFLGAAGAAATAGFATQPAAATETPHIRRLVPLGDTGLRISDIGFGSSRSADPNLVRHALDRGVTYFDTAESYRFGTSESAMGEGLAGVRDQVVLASKTKAYAGDTATEMMAALEDSLARLKTDYLDIYYNHAVNDADRMQNQEWWAFTERAKEQGKIRFRAMSGHGSRLVECLDYAIDNDLVDVVLCAYNFGQDQSFLDTLRHTFHFSSIQPDLPRVLKKAQAKGVGVIAMKTLMGAKLNDMRPYERPGGTFAQAAFRWTLSQPWIDALVISMTSKVLIDEYVAASGDPELTDHDSDLLNRYVYAEGAAHCRHGCDHCEGACPHGVDIAEVLRTRMYWRDYRDATLAVTDYRALGAHGAGACLGCAHQACRNACPFGVPIARWTRETALRLG